MYILREKVCFKSPKIFGFQSRYSFTKEEIQSVEDRGEKTLRIFYSKKKGKKKFLEVEMKNNSDVKIVISSIIALLNRHLQGEKNSIKKKENNINNSINQ